MRLNRQRPDEVAQKSPAQSAVAPCAEIERWVLRHLGTVRHERRVSRIATDLFNLTRRLHGLGTADRRLLQHAALVHDVGRCISKDGHEVEGARLVRHDSTLPVDSAERRALAYLTLHHRGAVPAAGTDTILHCTDDHDRLLKILALLRTADAFDSRSLEPVHLNFTLMPPAHRSASRVLKVIVSLQIDTPKARKVYGKRKKFRLLEEVLDVRMDVEMESGESRRIAA